MGGLPQARQEFQPARERAFSSNSRGTPHLYAARRTTLRNARGNTRGLPDWPARRDRGANPRERKGWDARDRAMAADGSRAQGLPRLRGDGFPAAEVTAHGHK